MIILLCNKKIVNLMIPKEVIEMKKKDLAFYIVFGVLMLAFLGAIIKLEIDVQRRWDAYEQKVFYELRQEVD